MFKPSNDRILIKPLEDDQKTEGGIIIPDTAQDKPIKGEVMAVGPGTKETPQTSCKVGDIVLYGKWSGTEVKISSKDYVIVRDGDVLGVLQD